MIFRKPVYMSYKINCSVTILKFEKNDAKYIFADEKKLEAEEKELNENEIYKKTIAYKNILLVDSCYSLLDDANGSSHIKLRQKDCEITLHDSGVGAIFSFEEKIKKIKEESILSLAELISIIIENS